jgi:hypothetical protein
MLYFCFTPALPFAIYVTDLLCFTEIFTFILLLYSDCTPSSLCTNVYIYALLPLYSCFSFTYIYMLYSCMLALKYLCIFMFVLCFTPASLLLIYVTAAILLYLNVFICTPALLVLYSYFSCCVCVFVPAYWPRRVCGGQ